MKINKRDDDAFGFEFIDDNKKTSKKPSKETNPKESKPAPKKK